MKSLINKEGIIMLVLSLDKNSSISNSEYNDTKNRNSFLVALVTLSALYFISEYNGASWQ